MLAVAHGLLGRPPLPILSSQSLSGVFRYFGNISVRESPSSRVAQTLGHVATPPRLGASGCQFDSGEDRTSNNNTTLASSRHHLWQHKAALRSRSLAAVETLLVPSNQVAQPHYLARPLAGRLREELVRLPTTPPP